LFTQDGIEMVTLGSLGMMRFDVAFERGALPGNQRSPYRQTCPEFAAA
jgi:hypothetical protein